MKTARRRSRAPSVIPLFLTLLFPNGGCRPDQEVGEREVATSPSDSPTVSTRTHGTPADSAGEDRTGEPSRVPQTVPDIPAFRDHDDDHDGRLSNEEFGAWVDGDGVHASWVYEAGGDLNRDAVGGRLIRFWDADHDSLVSEAEFTAGLRIWYGPDDPGVFADWDRDGDHELETEEVVEALEVRGMYGRIDANHDAIVDEGELAAWLFDVIDTSDDQRIDPDEWTRAAGYGWIG